MPALVNRAVIGANIRAAREAAGLSRDLGAAMFGTSAEAVQKWELGRVTFRPDALAQIARCLRVKPSALTRGAGGVAP